MPGQEDYKKMLTELIQKQMVILGPNIALDKARQVPGVVVADDGSVTQVTGDPQMVLKGVADEYIALSPQVARMTLSLLGAKYPEVKGL